MTSIKPQEALLRCIEHREIFHDEMLSLFRSIMGGEMSPIMIAALTVGLRVKKETVGEIAAAAQVMREGRIQAVIVGADRIASNGDTANKIGTYGAAVLAHYHKIPFYVAAPYSTFDLNLKSGADIPIEQRDSAEITGIPGKATAPEGVKTYNPAFDVTPHELIRAFITDRGVIEPPFAENLAFFTEDENLNQ